jgi:hypothetical protein
MFIDYTELFVLSPFISKAFFVFLGLPNSSEFDPFEEWLNDDKFEPSVYSDGTKRHLIEELNRLKDSFRSNISSLLGSSGKNANEFSGIQVVYAIQSGKNQIDKLRLVIQNDIYIVSNLHKPTGVIYIVARANWIDNQGKKFRKFAKNIGSDQKVLVNGKIPDWKKNEVRKELYDLMLKQYRSEYG